MKPTRLLRRSERAFTIPGNVEGLDDNGFAVNISRETCRAVLLEASEALLRHIAAPHQHPCQAPDLGAHDLRHDGLKALDLHLELDGPLAAATLEEQHFSEVVLEQMPRLPSEVCRQHLALPTWANGVWALNNKTWRATWHHNSAEVRRKAMSEGCGNAHPLPMCVKLLQICFYRPLLLVIPPSSASCRRLVTAGQ